MRLCTDPRDTYLNDIGYSVLRLPKKDVLPLTVIGRDRGNNEQIGTLSTIWKTSTPLPEPGPMQRAADISGRKTSDFGISIGLSILADALKMFGAKSPDLTTEFSSAHTLQIEFTDVHSIRIEPSLIDAWLKTGDVDSGSLGARYLGGGKGVDALVISEVLQAKSVAVNAKKDGGRTVAVDVPAIEGVVGASVKVSGHGSDATGVAFEGPEYLTFGFKAWKIVRLDGKWSVQGVKQSAATAFSAVASEEAAVPVLVDRGLIDL